jgi:chromosome partitioning protein
MDSIVVASAKGGTGKTTVALNLAVALAEKGRRTLIVDLDPQGSIGLSLRKQDTEWPGLAEVMMDDATLEEAIVQTKLQSLSILPRGRLDPADAVDYERALFDSDILRLLFSDLADRYRYAIVDTPSGVGMIARAALRNARYVLVPMQAEMLALRSSSQLFHVIDHVKRVENPRLELLGILPTMVSLDQDASLGVVSTMWSGFGGIMDAYIPRADVFAEASISGLPIGFLGGTPHPECKRFDMLATEVDELVTRFGGRGETTHERPHRELV